MLQRLIYVSRATRELDLAPLVEAAARTNLSVGVTGLLLCEDHTILQVLEGPRTMVSSLFVRIAADRRHTNVTLVEACQIEEPCYPPWGMILLDDAVKTRALWASHTARFDLFEMPAHSIRDFVRLASFELLSSRSSATAATR